MERESFNRYGDIINKIEDGKESDVRYLADKLMEGLSEISSSIDSVANMLRDLKQKI